MMTSNINYCIIGAYSSGKTSLAQTFLKNKQNVNNESTIGASLIVNYMNLQSGSLFRLNIWDTAGQERYAPMLPMYSRTADVIIFTIDPLNTESVEYIKKITPVILDPRIDNLPIAINLVVTKMDAQYGDTHARELMSSAKSYLTNYFSVRGSNNIIIGEYYTSAMTCYNVDLPFIDKCTEILKHKIERNSNSSVVKNTIINIADDDESKPSSSYYYDCLRRCSWN